MRRGETSSALVKYLSNRAFHSRDCGVAEVPSGRAGDGDGESSLKGTKGMATPRSVASLIFIRKISREDGGRRRRQSPIAVLLPSLRRLV